MDVDMDIIAIDPEHFHAVHKNFGKDKASINGKMQDKLSVFVNTYKDVFHKQDQLYHAQLHQAAFNNNSPSTGFSARQNHPPSSRTAKPYGYTTPTVGNKKYPVDVYSRQHWNEDKKSSQCVIRERKKIGHGTDIHRYILSILNKVSPGNGQKLKQKLLAFCGDDQDRMEVCITELVKKCAGDIQFVFIYIDILKSIMETHRHLVHILVARFIGDFIMSLPSRLMQLYGIMSHDNNLSQYLRLKKSMNNDNKCICLLLVHKCTCIDSDQYLCHIKRVFDQVEVSSDVFDIFIHFVYDFFMYHVSHTLSSDSNSFIRILLERKDGDCSKCTAFKLEDLVHLFKKNNHLLEI